MSNRLDNKNIDKKLWYLMSHEILSFIWSRSCLITNRQFSIIVCQIVIIELLRLHLKTLIWSVLNVSHSGISPMRVQWQRAQESYSDTVSKSEPIRLLSSPILRKNIRSFFYSSLQKITPMIWYICINSCFAETGSCFASKHRTFALGNRGNIRIIQVTRKFVYCFDVFFA